MASEKIQDYSNHARFVPAYHGVLFALIFLGLIGSKSKRARFLGRLRADGFGEAALARVTCPIGLAGLHGKAPEVIAVSVVADLLLRLEASRRAMAREPALASL